MALAKVYTFAAGPCLILDDSAYSEFNELIRQDTSALHYGFNFSTAFAQQCETAPLQHHPGLQTNLLGEKLTLDP